MGAKPQRPEGRDGAIYALNVAIDAVNAGKDISAGVASAQAIFGSLGALLTVIRVPSLLFCRDGLPIHIYLGLYGQRTGLHRTWAQPRGYQQSA
jgi:hypothetical protein